LNENSGFYDGFLTGSQGPPRWFKVIVTICDSLEAPIDRLYVARFLDPASIAKVRDMAANIRAALRDDLQKVTWMDDATRVEAIEKLDALAIYVGYPEEWPDTGSIEITRGSFLLNVMHAQEVMFERDMARIEKPVDRKEWLISAHTCDALYEFRQNAIVIPAGFLQLPYFSPKSDDAQNYGEIGAAIGHELTHPFDDLGRRFDARGNLRNWWTDKANEEFKKRSRRIIDQYDQYIAVDDLHVDGAQTVGENLADLGGVKIAYLAMEKASRGRPSNSIDGFSSEQRFFLAFADAHRLKIRPEMQRWLVRNNVHAPPRFRVNGSLSNLPEFYEAFDVPVGKPMYRSSNDRVDIW
jgi:predicted metalloendopeptidase